jgi:hypothetical protein
MVERRMRTPKESPHEKAPYPFAGRCFSDLWVGPGGYHDGLLLCRVSERLAWTVLLWFLDVLAWIPGGCLYGTIEQPTTLNCTGSPGSFLMMNPPDLKFFYLSIG